MPLVICRGFAEVQILMEKKVKKAQRVWDQLP